MHQPVPVQLRQARRQGASDLGAFGDRKAGHALEIQPQGAGHIVRRVARGGLRGARQPAGEDLGAVVGVIGQLHYVIEAALRVIPADVQHLHQAVAGAGQRLVGLDAAELALERADAVEAAPVNDLHRPQDPHDIARQPDLAVAAPADHAQQLVIGNRGWWGQGVHAGCGEA